MKILDLQTQYDAQAHKTADVAQEARAYVPPFLNIQANDLISWFSTKIPARIKLSCLCERSSTRQDEILRK